MFVNVALAHALSGVGQLPRARPKPGLRQSGRQEYVLMVSVVYLKSLISVICSVFGPRRRIQGLADL